MTTTQLVFHYENCNLTEVLQHYKFYLENEDKFDKDENWGHYEYYENGDTYRYVDTNRKETATIIGYFPRK